MSNTPGDHGSQGGEEKIPTWGLILGKHFLLWMMKNLGHRFPMGGCPLEPQCLGELGVGAEGQPGSPRRADPLVCLCMWFHMRFFVRKGFQFPKVFGDHRQNDGWDWEDTSGTSSGPWADASSLKASLSPSVECGVGQNDPNVLPNSEAWYSGFTLVDTSRGSVGTG